MCELFLKSIFVKSEKQFQGMVLWLLEKGVKTKGKAI